MLSTLQAVLVALFAILPGALYTWSFEQQAGRWGFNAGDRIQRFIGASAFFLVVELPVLYNVVYRRYVVSGDIGAGRALPWWVWFLPVAFIVLPVAVGRIVGRASWSNEQWVKIITGPSPAPRAWDGLFATANLTGWIRLRLKNDTWACGLWGESVTTGLKSYAAGYPESQDLLISELAEIDDGGEFLTDDRDGTPVLTGRSLLIRWDEVTYAEFIPG